MFLLNTVYNDSLTVSLYLIGPHTPCILRVKFPTAAVE